ncbi:hypothetical protein P3W45_001619 [Vairimorpha bombi]|jgi:ABC-type multidrug transport system fused ATPase/permease subunit
MLRKKVTANSFIYDLVFKYFLLNPMFKIYILPIIVLIYLSAALHSYIIISVNNLEVYLVSDIKQESPGYLIMIYLLYTVSHYAITLFCECIFAFYLQSTVVSSFKIHIKEYIMLYHADYHSLGSGKIHTLVERRTKGIIDFIDLLIMNVYTNFIGIFVIYSVISQKLGLSLMFFNLGVLVIYLLFCVFISFEIYRRRAKANLDYNECSNRIYGILNNYDVIKAYNNDTLEINKLNKKCSSVEISWFYFETVCNITKFIQILILVVPNSIILYMVINGKGFSYLGTFANLSLYHKQFLSLRGNMDKLGKEILKFIQTYTDVNDSYLVGKQLDNNDKGRDIQVFTEKIQFKNFSLFMKDVLLIDKLNLTINKGDKVAIVGKNGSGKSTLIKTLLRFYDYEGEVLIDNNNMLDISVTSQRNLISYIPQNAYIIEGTVLDNLKYSNKKITNQEIKKLCLEFNTHDIFAKLEDGYMTSVGESGKFLSGGQKQQVSFMRGVIKDGEIFLIDEPTANLDKVAERELINNVFTRLRNKTVLLILHNFEFLKGFDKIIGFHERSVKLYENYEDFLVDAYLY